MNSENLRLIEEINQLWKPVYPYLAQHILEVYGRQDGNILEVGPFCGVIFNLQEEKVGDSFLIATFPPKMTNYFRREAIERGVEGKIKVFESDPYLSGIEEKTIDLAIFRGAFFFPSLGEANLSEIHRVLRPGGFAFIGGGFGKQTPEAVIKNIGKKSQELNLRLGKIHLSEKKLRQNLQATKLKGKIELISEGGLWVIMKK